MSQLHSLILHKCSGIPELLSAVVDSAIVLKLKRLEIISNDHPALDQKPLKIRLIQLLESFAGLERLILR